MSVAFLGLGSNLGNRAGNLTAALERLSENGAIPVRVSSIWESAPEPPDQPAYLNAVCLVRTRPEPALLLSAVKRIEHALGRRPGRRWGPRPVDLDLLLFDGVAIATPDLTVPHPRMMERAFVLAPLLEVLEQNSPLFGDCVRALVEIGKDAWPRRRGERLEIRQLFSPPSPANAGEGGSGG